VNVAFVALPVVGPTSCDGRLVVGLLSLGNASQLSDMAHHRATPHDVERLNEYWAEFVRAVDHKEHKLEKATRLFRRVVGRIDPTDREVNTLMGVFGA
jgi:tRNA C32,U32 (ribose-2'-O)-methylase TrmJ